MPLRQTFFITKQKRKTMIKQLMFLASCLLCVPINSMHTKKNNFRKKKLFIDAAIRIIGKKFPEGNTISPKLIIRKNETVRTLQLRNKKDPIRRMWLMLTNAVIGDNGNTIMDTKKLIAIMHYAPSSFLHFCEKSDIYTYACDYGHLPSPWSKAFIETQIVSDKIRMLTMMRPKNIRAQKTTIVFDDLSSLPGLIRSIDLNEKPCGPKGSIGHLSSVQKKHLKKNLKKIVGEHRTFRHIYECLQPTPIFKKKPEKGVFDLIIHTKS